MRCQPPFRRLLAALAALIYRNVGEYSFVFDDGGFIVSNTPILGGLSRESVRWAFTATHTKLERINRHFEQVIDVKVIMSVQKLDQKIEATVHLSGKDIHVDCHDADMYAAIDGLVDKLDRQIIKHKDRFEEGRRGGAPKREAP